ncbi:MULTISPECIES: HlyD family efflux transporter periplasmic adaptor subunit [unclassified Bradyrhizobium]|uniref:HlyD family secretion protein n=1 Tax=unclassified Bradyrhizobium TaxID=2631580 RepID=UPI001CD783BF|nr:MULTISPECIES: HlyD family efflux transporter periplasmic adaptor subunit [unclassified Bradyrhizobium]MCA1376083.1 HlyD family efflux transporter periplasmic adaptor subunit [Bradyrhizobium sp. IC4060]MCA1482809.1 HlyD family efflux transporter periplasmic adaptor subunit [Bradyrhizobium sp. IC4061]MCA1540195.1 HlyD family efflux transporter periplasmic adaptor subunit [Bradyrhizobium sp. NBAIM32]
MNIEINRLDPNVPDPVESRRRAAGRMVRFAYAVVVFGVLAFFVVYFGAPFVYLGGAGTVASPRHVVSLPYTVQITRMNLESGALVKAGEEIADVISPEQDSIVATYMRALADINGRTAELRIKARVAQESLSAARAYLQVTREAVERVEAMASATVTFRMDVLRERAAASKAVVSHEAEVAESAIQLASLDTFIQQLNGRLDEVQRHYNQGKVFAPVGGIVSTSLARVGQSLTAGTSIAEILDPSDIFVDWYIPNERLIEPKVGKEVFVLFGNRRIPGKIVQILPVSAVYAVTQQVQIRDRPATQIARIQFDPGTSAPPLNSTVYVHMHYSQFAGRIASALVSIFGLD